MINVENWNACPTDPEELAEAYVMNILPPDQSIAFEDHFVACDACATILQEAAGYMTGMEEAARELRSEGRRAEILPE